MGVQRAWDVPQFSWGGGCTEPETVGIFIVRQFMVKWDARMLSPAYNLYIRHTGFYEGQKISLQDCIKVWTTCIRILWRSEDFASGLYEGLKNSSGLYEGLKNASWFYEGLKNQPKKSISILRAPQQLASGFYEGLQIRTSIVWALQSPVSYTHLTLPTILRV